MAFSVPSTKYAAWDARFDVCLACIARVECVGRRSVPLPQRKAPLSNSSGRWGLSSDLFCVLAELMQHRIVFPMHGVGGCQSALCGMAMSRREIVRRVVMSDAALCQNCLALDCLPFQIFVVRESAQPSDFDGMFRCCVPSSVCIWCGTILKVCRSYIVGHSVFVECHGATRAHPCPLRLFSFMRPRPSPAVSWVQSIGGLVCLIHAVHR